MLDPNFTITTPRLIVSHFIPTDPSHILFVMTLNHSLEMQQVDQTQPTAKPAAQAFESQMDLQAAQAYVDKAAERMERTGYGRYMICLKDESGNRGKMIGTVSMTLARYAVAPSVPDLGFKISPEFGGKGYVTEAARGIME
jgi:RimJ/RimL family protein N-acetyltransferase